MCEYGFKQARTATFAQDDPQLLAMGDDLAGDILI
jgi:hypothetical protein